jgi:predicted secreted protein
MEMSKIFLLLTLFALLSAVPAFAASEPGAVIVTKKDNGKEISVPQGGVVEIQMEYPAATGYSWEITDLDKNLLEVLDVGTRSLKEGKIVGGPILKTWRIKAARKGQTELKMYYYRSWEGLENAADKFHLRIRIT